MDKSAYVYGAKWKTEDEISFLKRIGQWRDFSGRRPELNNQQKTRGELLTGYAKAARRRTEWGDIEPEKVFKYLAANGAPV